MKSKMKYALVLGMVFALSACDDEKTQAQVQQQQVQQVQQQDPQYVQAPAQPVIINNQQPSGSSGVAEFVAGAVVGHAVANMGNNNSRSYNNDRYYGSNQKTYKSKTTIVNNNTFITQPTSTKPSYYGSTSKSSSTLSTSKPKSKYSNVFSSRSKSKKR